jgi:UDP-glucuronate decarboxylase
MAGSIRLPIKVARIFNTYGPRMRPGDGRVVSDFIVQALNGENVTIYGDGLQTRSFCYVEELVDGLVRLMESAPESPARSTSATRRSSRSPSWPGW